MTTIDSQATEPRPDTLDPEIIDLCQFEGAKFTEAELDAIGRYSSTIAGVPDCFVGFDVDTLREFGPEHVHIPVRYLQDWHDALTKLYWELIHEGRGRLTPPAARYIDLELNAWRRAKHDVATAAVEFLGADPLSTGFDVGHDLDHAWRNDGGDHGRTA